MNVAALAVPLLVTVAEAPGERVVAGPAAIVAAVPVAPVLPVAPVAPVAPTFP